MQGVGLMNHILFDRSTAYKHLVYIDLCIAIRCSSTKENIIVTEYVGLILTNDTIGEVLFTVIRAAITNLGLILGNSINFASDGASVMTSVNYSVWTQIQQVSRVCASKCICHSPVLCVKHAFGKMPS